MNTYNAQNPSEMLHLLFDGELDSSMETPLYASLMQNEELRSELRELIAIRESIRRDVEAFTPPVAATQGIFNKLGYAVPLAFRGMKDIPAGFLGLIKQRLWNPAVTAILASLITAFLFLNFNNANDNSVNDNSTANSQFASGKQNNTAKSKIIPSVNIGDEKTLLSSNNDIQKTNNDLQKTKVIYKEKIKYVYVTKDDLQSDNSMVQVVNTIDSESENTTPAEEIGKDSESWLGMTNPENLFSFDNVNLKPIQLPSLKSNQREFVLTDNFYPKTPEKHSLLLQLKGMSVTSFPNVEFNDAAGGMLRNFSVGAYVPLTNNIHFGLEGGQEPFSQVFYHVENNQLYKIEQNPVLQWAGFGIKFNLEKQIEYLANAQPFLNLTIASTKVGPYGKAIAGLQFISANGLGVMIGLEAGSLVYQEQKTFYSTEKLGITYGMFMKF